VAWPTGQSF